MRMLVEGMLSLARAAEFEKSVARRCDTKANMTNGRTSNYVCVVVEHGDKLVFHRARNSLPVGCRPLSRGVEHGDRLVFHSGGNSQVSIQHAVNGVW